jgi:hypothetical protein
MAEDEPCIGKESHSQVTDESDEVMFENKIGLAEDMKRLGRSQLFCDVKFIVGESREPLYAVKAVLASRSK